MMPANSKICVLLLSSQPLHTHKNTVGKLYAPFTHLPILNGSSNHWRCPCRCVLELPKCYSNPCKGGGTCHDLPYKSYKCSCFPAFTGERCEYGQYHNISEHSRCIGHWSLARFPAKTLVFSPTCGTSVLSVAYLVWISLDHQNDHWRSKAIKVAWPDF